MVFPTKHAFPIFDIVVAVDTRSGGDYLLAELEDEGLGFYLEEA